jgi:hypothetical protein
MEAGESRRREEEQELEPSKRSKAQLVESSVPSEGRDCPICLEPWGVNGGHRIAALKCGHLFGQECIEKWIKTHQNCPNCQEKASKKDVRLLFVSTVTVMDTSTMDRLKRDLECEKLRRVQAEMDKARLKVQIEALQASILQMRRQYQPVPMVSNANSLSSSPTAQGSTPNHSTDVTSIPPKCVQSFSDQAAMQASLSCPSNDDRESRKRLAEAKKAEWHRRQREKELMQQATSNELVS